MVLIRERSISAKDATSITALVRYAEAGAGENALRRLLGGAYTIVGVADSDELSEILDAGAADCVLLGYRLDGADSMAVLETLAARRVPVVMVTAHGDEAVAVEAMKRGACDYLSVQDLTAARLRAAIDSAITHMARRRDGEERQKALEAFPANIAHDLNAPLRTVGAFVHFIKEDIEAGSTEQLLKHCDGALSGVNRMTGLIKGLLDHVRAGRRRPFETVDLNRVAEDVVAGLDAPMRDASAEIFIDDLPEIWGDTVALSRVLQNLIENALKFRRDGVPSRIWIAANRGRDVWTISVTDNGTGIDPEQHRKIFEPFARLRVREADEGNGLGLATCKQVVGHHGGRIWVESEPGKGATFCFTLPKTDARL